MNKLTNPDRYTPIAQTYTPTELTVPAFTVRIGDVVAGRGVADVRTGPKNTELVDVDGKRIAYVPRQSEVQVNRMVADEDIAELLRRTARNANILDSLNTRRAKLDRARVVIDQALESEYGYAGYGELNNLLAAQAEHRVWDEFAGFVDNLAARTGDKEFHGDLVDAMLRFTEYLTKEVLASHKHRSLSKSSSVTSNLLDDVLMEARVEFIDQVRWF